MRKWNSRRHRLNEDQRYEEEERNIKERRASVGEKKKGRKESSCEVEVLKKRKMEEGELVHVCDLQLHYPCTLQYYSEGLSVKYRRENNKE